MKTDEIEKEKQQFFIKLRCNAQKRKQKQTKVNDLFEFFVHEKKSFEFSNL